MLVPRLETRNPSCIPWNAEVIKIQHIIARLIVRTIFNAKQRYVIQRQQKNQVRVIMKKIWGSDKENGHVCELQSAVY